MGEHEEICLAPLNQLIIQRYYSAKRTMSTPLATRLRPSSLDEIVGHPSARPKRPFRQAWRAHLTVRSSFRGHLEQAKQLWLT